jgi:hypothetical protein
MEIPPRGHTRRGVRAARVVFRVSGPLLTEKECSAAPIPASRVR